MTDEGLKTCLMYYAKESARNLTYDIINKIGLREDCQDSENPLHIDRDKITQKALLSIHFSDTIIQQNDKFLIDFIRLAFLAGYRVELTEIED